GTAVELADGEYFAVETEAFEGIFAHGGDDKAKRARAASLTPGSGWCTVTDGHKSALSARPWLGIMARFQFSRLGAPAMLRISQEALTFDDVLLIPGYSEVL